MTSNEPLQPIDNYFEQPLFVDPDGRIMTQADIDRQTRDAQHERTQRIVRNSVVGVVAVGALVTLSSGIAYLVTPQQHAEQYSAVAYCPEDSQLIIDSSKNSSAITENEGRPPSIKLACERGGALLRLVDLQDVKDIVAAPTIVGPQDGSSVPYDVTVAYSYESNIGEYGPHLYRVNSQSDEDQAQQIYVSGTYHDKFAIDAIDIDPR